VVLVCRVAGLLLVAAVLAATNAYAEDLGCTKYVPQIGKTIRIPCNDTPAPPPKSVEPQSNPTPAPAPPRSREADAGPCLSEENPGTATGICQVYLNNNAGISQTTKAAVYAKLAWASLRVKDYQAALSWSKKSLEIEQSAVEHYIAGQAYAAMKNPSSAIEEFSAALVLAPKYMLALHRRGEAYLEIGDVEHAKDDFQAAIALHSKFTPSLEALRRLRRRD
jgi:tetratricopeptide (TPR) repeat protein